MVVNLFLVLSARLTCDLRVCFFEQAYERKLAGAGMKQKTDEVDSHRVAVSKFVQKVCQ